MLHLFLQAAPNLAFDYLSTILHLRYPLPVPRKGAQGETDYVHM